MMLSDELENKVAKRIDRKVLANERREKSPKGVFDRNKVLDDVLDKTTIMTLSKMINSGIISYVNGAVGSGKESKVYWAVDPTGRDIALKIYLVTATNFKKRLPYLIGDPRFSSIKKGTRNMVELWAKKEFRNLNQCVKAGIPAVKPISLIKNVLALEFVGKGGVPDPTLVGTEVTYDDYKQSILIISDLYTKAKLVHADFSEYNVFKTQKGLVVLDFGSSVDIRHQNAKEFLERDITNITRFFVKRGLTVENPSDIFERIMN